MIDNGQWPYPRLFSPLVLRSFTLRNRIVMGSMHMRLEHARDPIASLAAFYAARARGGAALLVTGGVAPNEEGRLEVGAPVLTSRSQVADWRKITEKVHDEGGRIAMQILHAGRYAKHELLVAPSAIASPINRRAPRPLTDGDIRSTLDDFARCAELAMDAGFDGIELMGSEGYLLNQFMAARSNDRDDHWGGASERRRNFPLAVAGRVRRAIGADRLLIYRLSIADLVENGATADETDHLAQALEREGMDVLSTGIGWHEARIPTIAAHVPQGAWRFAVARLKRGVSLPVMASNRVNTPALAEAMIAGGEADLVAMARPLLADPDLPVKAAEGRDAEINTCIACNQGCLDYIFSDRIATCLVNPKAGREAETEAVPAIIRRRVAVVGAGVAGLACAVTAAARGHDVTLFEASDAIGGQFLLAQKVPTKHEFGETLRYFATKLDRTGVALRLGVKADAEMLAGLGFDEVVISTGVAPRRPDIPGIDDPRVVTYSQILSGEVVAGARVVIVGAGGIGLDTAQFLLGDAAATDARRFLLEWGVDPMLATSGGLLPPCPSLGRRDVTVLRRGLERPGDRLGISTAWILRARLKALGARFIAGCQYSRIDAEGMHIVTDRDEQVLPADTIVLCAGQEKSGTLLEDLKRHGVTAQAIGGARSASELDALAAISDGVRIGEEI